MTKLLQETIELLAEESEDDVVYAEVLEINPKTTSLQFTEFAIHLHENGVYTLEETTNE